MRVASSTICMDVREFGGRGLRATGGSVATLYRRPEAPAPACTGSEDSVLRVTDSYDASASPTGVAGRVVHQVIPTDAEYPDLDAQYLGLSPTVLGRRHRPKVSKAKMARTRLAVYTRDGFACRHCGWAPPVPEGYDGSQGALGTLEKRPGRRFKVMRVLMLDHIYPYLLGGPFTVDNLQSLCTICNNRKGAKV